MQKKSEMIRRSTLEKFYREQRVILDRLDNSPGVSDLYLKGYLKGIATVLNDLSKRFKLDDDEQTA